VDKGQGHSTIVQDPPLMTRRVWETVSQRLRLISA